VNRDRSAVVAFAGGRDTLTDTEIRHNLEVPENAFGYAEGYRSNPAHVIPGSVLRTAPE
jgi:hypothetical protein